MGTCGGGDWNCWWNRRRAVSSLARFESRPCQRARLRVKPGRGLRGQSAALFPDQQKPDRAPEYVAALPHDRERLTDTSREAKGLRYLPSSTFVDAGTQRNKLERNVDDSIYRFEDECLRQRRRNRANERKCDEHFHDSREVKAHVQQED